jgi:hypothetical protein
VTVISRRAFLRLSIVVGGGAVTALMAGQSAKAWLLARVRALYQSLLSPNLEDSPTGSVDVRALSRLLEAVRAVTAVPVQISHYEDFFRWRAENLRGYKALYEQFAEALDHRARQAVGCDFVDCSRPVQQQILEQAPHIRNTSTRLDKVRLSILERHWLLFDRYIVREILLIFSKTDAWTSLGYQGWPGTPRGLDQYTRAAATPPISYQSNNRGSKG